jgi:electron transport complex protein RnfA
MGDYLLLIISAILVSNIVLARYLGNCPFLGVSQKMDTAVGMGMAVIFVVTLAGMITWVVQYAILNPLGLEYLRTIAFILVIASLVQLVEMFLQKSVPALYKALGIFLPLITTNCAVLGIAIINIQEEFNFMRRRWSFHLLQRWAFLWPWCCWPVFEKDSPRPGFPVPLPVCPLP